MDAALDGVAGFCDESAVAAGTVAVASVRVVSTETSTRLLRGPERVRDMGGVPLSPTESTFCVGWSD